MSRRINIALSLFIFIAAGAAAGQSWHPPGPRPRDAGSNFLGPHNNGGRGCAGCHVPHNGVAGGASAIPGMETFTATPSGSNALFVQEVSPLFGQALTLGNGYIEALSSESTAYDTELAELHSIMMCLACHDGHIAKGQTATGKSWEELSGLLPVATSGTRSIPTLLGQGDTSGYGYGMGHPVGKQATLGAVGLVSANGGKPTDPLTVIVGNGGIENIFPTPGSSYAIFATNYGYPSIAGNAKAWGVALPIRSTDSSTVFLTCTTCHNQHAMYIYQAPRGKQALTAMLGGTYPTYFFVNAPYNPGSGNTNPTTADSATQFCRQCHIGDANETFGVNTVKTRF